MTGNERAMKAADRLLEELKGVPHAPSKSGEAVGKLNYTHEAMLDLIISHPELDQNHLAARFGYTPGWVSRVIATEAFQSSMAKRREEIIDPAIKATIEERFKALTIQSLEVLMKKLSEPQVSDTVAIRAAELGAKALGVGGNAPPPPSEAGRLERLAERLLSLQGGIRERVIQGETLSVETNPAS